MTLGQPVSLDVLFPWNDDDLVQPRLRELMAALDRRLETLDAVTADWETEAERLANEGIERVNDTINPILAEVEAARVAALADLQGINAALAQANQVVSGAGGFNSTNYILLTAYNTAMASRVKQVEFDAAIATRVTIATANIELANRVRVDAQQAFTDPQKAVGRANLTSGPRIVTGADTLTVDDRERLIYIPATVTVGFMLTHIMTAAAAGAGFRYRIKSDAPRVSIILDPVGSETIDGQTTLKCLAKQQFMVESDGTKWITFGRVSAAVASVDFTLPDDYDTFEIILGNIKVSADTHVGARLAFDAAGTAFVATNSYNGAYALGGGPATFGGDGSAASISWLRTIYQASTGYPSDARTLLHPGSATTFAKHLCTSGGQSTSQYWNAQYSWLYHAALARATGLRFFCPVSAATFTSGLFQLSGRVEI
jgi:hypothetical protein